MHLDNINHFFRDFAEVIGGAITGAISGVALFINNDFSKAFETLDIWFIVFKILGVVFVTFLGGTVGFFTKRFWNKKYGND